MVFTQKNIVLILLSFLSLPFSQGSVSQHFWQTITIQDSGLAFDLVGVGEEKRNHIMIEHLFCEDLLA